MSSSLSDTNESVSDDKEKFSCHYCGKQFSTKSNLKTHQKNTKKCLELRKEILTNENFDDVKTPGSYSPPITRGIPKSDSLDDVSLSTLSNIESEMRYLVDSNLNLLSHIVELNKQIRAVSLRLNQIDKKYNDLIPSIAHLIKVNGTKTDE